MDFAGRFFSIPKQSCFLFGPFREEYPEADVILLHRGPEHSRIDGVWCLPADDFLRQTLPDRGLLAWL